MAVSNRVSGSHETPVTPGRGSQGFWEIFGGLRGQGYKGLRGIMAWGLRGIRAGISGGR